jgi:hypothetical protein
MVANEHKALIEAYRHEPVLKQTINVFTKKSSFAEGWSLLKVCFPKFD